MKKIFIKKIFVLFKLNGFRFEISSFSSPGFCFSFILHLPQLVCVASKASLNFTLQVCDYNFYKVGI